MSNATICRVHVLAAHCFAFPLGGAELDGAEAFRVALGHLSRDWVDIDAVHSDLLRPVRTVSLNSSYPKILHAHESFNGVRMFSMAFCTEPYGHHIEYR